MRTGMGVPPELEPDGKLDDGVKALSPPQPTISANISGNNYLLIRPTMCHYASE